MRSSLILQTAVRYLVPLMLMFSFFLLLRGHNEPGGGFVGGLVAAAAFSLYGIAYDIRAARRVLSIRPGQLMAAGLLTAVASGLIGVGYGNPFMTGLWDTTEFPAIGKLGTPLLFDIGVYLVVIGVTTSIIFALVETTEEEQ